MPRMEKWYSRSEWNKLVDGDDCPMCRELKTNDIENKWGFTVINLPTGRFRLMKNQYALGYCVFICNQHVVEPIDLSEQLQKQYFADLMLVYKAIQIVFKPDKLNLLMLGNGLPHLHSHIIPRYLGDSAPGTIIDLDNNYKELCSKQKYAEYIEKLNKALTNLKN